MQSDDERRMARRAMRDFVDQAARAAHGPLVYGGADDPSAVERHRRRAQQLIGQAVDMAALVGRLEAR